MAKKKQEFIWYHDVKTDEEFDEYIHKPGLIVADIYKKWCGPCEAIQSILKKIRIEIGDHEYLHFIKACSDDIQCLKAYRKTCEPIFLLFADGNIVAEVRGSNGPKLVKMIHKEYNVEKKLLEGHMQRKPFYGKMPEYEEELDELKEEIVIKPIRKTSSLILNCLQNLAFCAIAPRLEKEKLEEVFSLIKHNKFEIVDMKQRFLQDSHIKFLYKYHSDLTDDLVTYISKMYTIQKPTTLLVVTKVEANNVINKWNKFIGSQIDHSAALDLLKEMKSSKKDKIKRNNKFDRIKTKEPSQRKKAGSSNISSPRSTLRSLYDCPEEIYSYFWTHSDVHIHSIQLQAFFTHFVNKKLPVFRSKYSNLYSKNDIPNIYYPILILPQVKRQFPMIRSHIWKWNFYIVAEKELSLSLGQAMELFEEVIEINNKTFEEITYSLSKNDAIIVIIKCADSWKDIQAESLKLIGPSSVEVAKEIAPDSLRAQFGIQEHLNGFYILPTKTLQMEFIEKFYSNFIEVVENSLKYHKIRTMAIFPTGSEKQMHIIEKLYGNMCDVISWTEISESKEEKIQQVIQGLHLQEESIIRENLYNRIQRGFPILSIVFDKPIYVDLNEAFHTLEQPLFQTTLKRDINFIFPEVEVESSLAASQTSLPFTQALPLLSDLKHQTKTNPGFRIIIVTLYYIFIIKRFLL